ncbi:MAG: hypothetical protein J6J26_02575 [Bacteroides sp.]|nr:hypothetical protein [Bacteroides sp.]
MGNRSLKKYLYDIQQAIESIYKHLNEKMVLQDNVGGCEKSANKAPYQSSSSL